MAQGFSVSDYSLPAKMQESAEDLGGRRVLVKDLSPRSKKEDVIIHFQRKRNGGGEVDSVWMLGDGVAVVTFEKREGK